MKVDSTATAFALGQAHSVPETFLKVSQSALVLHGASSLRFPC